MSCVVPLTLTKDWLSGCFLLALISHLPVPFQVLPVTCFVYFELDVENTSNRTNLPEDRGKRRVVVEYDAQNDKMVNAYYTDDHYGRFRSIFNTK